jgi:hypothetical protein
MGRHSENAAAERWRAGVSFGSTGTVQGGESHSRKGKRQGDKREMKKPAAGFFRRGLFLMLSTMALWR